jgi:hypothetical protein
MCPDAPRVLVRGGCASATEAGRGAHTLTAAAVTKEAVFALAMAEVCTPLLIC